MTTKRSRREVLRLAALGGMSAVLAACAARTRDSVGRAPATPPPSPVPPTAPPATTVAPTTSPTALPPTSTPAAPLATTAGSAAATGAPAPPAAPPTPAATATPGVPTAALAAGIAQAANQFLASLTGAGLAKATYPFSDPERVRWHWTLPAGFRGMAWRYAT